MPKGLDATDNLTATASQLVDAGYGWVARYYFSSSQFKTLLSRSEAQALSSAGLYIVSVFESGEPIREAYFTREQGHLDANIAFNRAVGSGQPGGTPIYFAVDYDASTSDLTSIVGYFDAARIALQSLGSRYTCGVYGSGLVCRELSQRGFVSHTWLSQSKGFSGYDDWLPHASIVQGPEGTVLSHDVDADISNGSAGGWQLS